jgi:hypothetical protein
MENSFSNYLTDVKRQTNPVPSECTVCGAPAIYSYFGAIACQPCKMFFRRKNAQQGQVS